MNGPAKHKRRGNGFRLDHFLPFRRTPSKPPPPSFEVSARKLLRRIGPTALSSPVRRVVQGICFVLFLWLFFHVCWPYDARPQLAGSVHGGWRVAEFDQNSGGVILEREGGAADLREGQMRYLVDDGSDADHAGRFVLADIEADRLRLEPEGAPGAGHIDRLLFGVGPWALHESEPGRWPSHYADNLARKEIVPAESFLAIDPLVSLSTAIAARSWVWSLVCAGAILLACLLVPRGFCGYLCPLGTLIDLFDWAVGSRVKRFRVAGEVWWVHLK